MKRIFSKKGIISLLLSVCVGVAAAVVIFVILSAAASFLIVKASVPHRLIVPFASVIISLGALVGSFISGKLYHRRALIVGLVCAAVLFAVLCLSAVFSGESGYGVPTLVKGICSLVFCVIGAVSGGNTKTKI